MVRRIMAKAVLQIVKGDIQDTTGTKQLCTGQIAGVEIATHAAHYSFEHEDTEAVLLIDARNAFNSLNRKVAVHNVHLPAQSSPSSYRTCTGPPVTFSSMAKPSNLKREPLKATPLQCPCMPWQRYL